MGDVAGEVHNGDLVIALAVLHNEDGGELLILFQFMREDARFYDKTDRPRKHKKDTFPVDCLRFEAQDHHFPGKPGWGNFFFDARLTGRANLCFNLLGGKPLNALHCIIIQNQPPLAVRQHPGADINEISNSGFPLGMIKAQLEGKVKMCIKKDFASPRFSGAGRGF